MVLATKVRVVKLDLSLVIKASEHTQALCSLLALIV